jgi:hypothetical protein
MDRPGELEKDNRIPLATQARWGVNEPLKPDELRTAMTGLAEQSNLSSAGLRSPAGPFVSSAELVAALNSVDTMWAKSAHAEDFPDPAKVSAGQFAFIAARILLQLNTK